MSHTMEGGVHDTGGALVSTDTLNEDEDRDHDDDDDIIFESNYSLDEDEVCIEDDENVSNDQSSARDQEVELLYNKLSSYETELDRQRFKEFEEMLAECDDIMKESDMHLQSLDSIKSIVSTNILDLEQYDNQEEEEKKEEEENGILQLEYTKNTTPETSEDNALQGLELPAITDEAAAPSDQRVVAIPDEKANLLKILEEQLAEVDAYYSDILGRQEQVYQEIQEKTLDVTIKLEAEWEKKLATFEREKSICEQTKQAKEDAMLKWEEDHNKQIEEELEQQQTHIQELSSQLEKEIEEMETDRKTRREEQDRRLTLAATVIQSVYRRFRVRCQYGNVLEERREERWKRLTEEKAREVEEQRKAHERELLEEMARKKTEEERLRLQRKKEEEAEREKILEEKERLRRLKLKKEEEEKKRREEEEIKRKQDEERQKLEEEEKRKKAEVEEKKKKLMEAEKRKKLEEEKRRKLEEEKRKKLEEERRKLEEEEKIKKLEEERRKLEEEEKRKKLEEKKRKLEEEEKRKKLEEEKRKKLEEEENSRKLKEEMRQELENGDDEKDKREEKLKQEEKKRRQFEEKRKEQKLEESKEGSCERESKEGRCEGESKEGRYEGETVQKPVQEPERNIGTNRTVLTKPDETMSERKRKCTDVSSEKDGGVSIGCELGGESSTKEEEEVEKEDVDKKEENSGVIPNADQSCSLGKNVCRESEVEKRKIALASLAPLPPSLNDRRLAWMEHCIPWGKVSNQCWIGRNYQSNTSLSRKRPPSNKRLPSALTEDFILSTSMCTTLTQLTTLQLKDLPGCNVSTLGKCLNLQYLSAVNCRLVTLDGLQPCSQLKYIDVQNNSIEYVNVKNMDSLRYIDLSRNNMALIHGFEGCNNIVWLNLAHNHITKLDAGLRSLRRLHSLLLCGNQIVSTDGLDHSVATLHTLDLSHNQLHHLRDVGKLCLLQRLNATGNNLLEFPKLTNHVLLIDLQLSDNNLSSAEPLAECWFPLLQELNLGQNRLSSLPSMECAPLLKTINLTDNQLIDVENSVKSLAPCSHMERVSIDGNPVCEEEEFRNQLLTALPRLLSLDGSPLRTKGPSSTALTSFEQACRNQLDEFQKLKTKYQEETKYLSENDPVDHSSLCGVHVGFCCVSYKMAVEYRYMHEYGETSAVMPPFDEISHGSLVTAGLTAEERGDSYPKTHQSEDVASVKSKYQDKPITTDEKINTVCLPCKGDKEDQKTPRCLTDASLSMFDGTTNRNITAKERQQCDVINPAEGKVGDTALVHCSRSIAPGIKEQQDEIHISSKIEAAIRIQAAWRGFSFRSKLRAALDFAQQVYEGDSDFGEEIDLEAFDLAEADLDKAWSPPLTPSIPKSFPVLGKPPLFRNGSTHTDNGARISPGSANFPSPPPHPPREAWKSPTVTARTLQSIRGGRQSSGAMVLRNSSSSVHTASDQETQDDNSRLTDAQICEEWGFQDARTAHMMKERAKKMKFNAERRRKLKKLDPHQRLALFRKLDEVANFVPVKPSPAKVLPKKEYFQARQLGMNAGLGDDITKANKEEENQTKASRTYLWVHTQVSTFDGSDSNSLSHSDSPVSKVNKKIDYSQRQRLFSLNQHTYVRRTPPAAIGQQVSETGDVTSSSGPIRRYSTPGSRSSPIQLPPITRGSASGSHRRERISHRSPNVDTSGGWGGGRKRNKYK